MLMIEVYSPSVDMSYDFQIEEGIITRTAVETVCEMIARKNGCSKDGIAEKSALYDVRGERELDMQKTLKENSVVNGMYLMLV